MKKVDSADLILRLYDLRREETMRRARNWFIAFFPESADEIMQAILDEETSAYYRMVISYWEMAATFVNQGAIDEEMFNETNGEHIAVFSKVYPFLEELREKFDSPTLYSNLEKLILRMPDAREMLAKRREMLKQYLQMRQDMAKGAG